MKKFLFFVIVIVIVIVLIAGWVFKMVFVGHGNSTGGFETFVIEEGQGVNEISNGLKEKGLIENRFVFETYVWFRGYENKILAGEHTLHNTWSIRQIVNTLISGSSISNERELTFLPGWNLYDIAEYLQKQGVITKTEDFYAIVGQPGTSSDSISGTDLSSEYEFLKEKPEDLSLEGFLFPDTYRVFKDATVEDIVVKMLDNFDKKITSKMLGDIYNQDQNLYDIMTLASIIEKEGNTLENKKKVAGVYYNRLDAGIALQADPTVNYITGKSTDRPSLDDIDTDSLYNTYKYPGLPPGPICNPGLDSINAAIYPDKNDYYYFINTPDGEMIFSKTFEEHKANREKYFND